MALLSCACSPPSELWDVPTRFLCSGWNDLWLQGAPQTSACGLPQREQQCRWRWTCWCRRPRRASRRRRTTAVSCSSGCRASARPANRYVLLQQPHRHRPCSHLRALRSFCNTPPQQSKQCCYFLFLQPNLKWRK